jgi:pyruvate dehydrogenase E1 component alpha subunit
MKHRGQPNVAVAFFGDGAVNQGVFHESLNFASIWDLPVIYVCENNLYAMSARTTDLLAAESVAARARAYRIESVQVDGMDVLEVFRAADAAVHFARERQRPYFIECLTYRFAGHSKSDVRKYRSREEEQSWQARDPLALFSSRLLRDGVSDADEIRAIRDQVAEEVEAAVQFAIDSPENDPAELFTDVYVD